GCDADAGLGQPESRHLLPACLGHQPALALLLGAPLEEGQRVERDVDALDDTERRIGTFELLAQDREADVVHPRAAVRLGDRRTEEPLFGHPGEDLAMDLALLVPLADVRQDLRVGEGPGSGLDELVLIGEGEIGHGVPAYAANVTRGAARPQRGDNAVRPAATLRRWDQPSGPPRTSPRSSVATSSTSGATARATACSTPTGAATSTSRTASPSPRSDISIRRSPPRSTRRWTSCWDRSTRSASPSRSPPLRTPRPTASPARSARDTFCN